MTEEITCASCGKDNITTKMVDDILCYGDKPVRIPVVVPVRNCQDCGFKFLDWEAEDIYEKAVSDYLKGKPHSVTRLPLGDNS